MVREDRDMMGREGPEKEVARKEEDGRMQINVRIERDKCRISDCH